MKKKINIDALQVKSFVTTLGEQTNETVKGGTHPLICITIPVVTHHLCTGDLFCRFTEPGEDGFINN